MNVLIKLIMCLTFTVIFANSAKKKKKKEQNIMTFLQYENKLVQIYRKFYLQKLKIFR